MMVLGSLHSQEADASRATVLLRTASEVAAGQSNRSTAALASILLALAAEAAGDAAASAAAIDAAVKAFRVSGASLLKVTGDEETDAVVAPSESYLAAAEFLLDAHLLGAAEAALARAAATLADQDVPRALRVALLVGEARLFHLRGGADAALAEARLDAALELDRSSASVFTVKARVALAAGDRRGARAAIELAVGDWSAADTPVQADLLMHLAQLYLEDGVAGDAELLRSSKEVFLRVAQAHGWATAWLGAGKAAYLAGEPAEAEAGLNEANIRDNHNAEVWAWLSLLCMQAKPVARQLEGVQALDQALRLKLDAGHHAALLVDLAAAFSADGKEVVTEKVLRRVVTATADPHARLLLAQSLALQGKAEDAVEAYKQVLADVEDPADRRAALRGAGDALESLGRTQDAIKLRAQYA